MEKFQNRYGISSKLQEDILNYICRNADSTYEVLAQYLKRNVRTIGQSIRTLEKNFYLERELLIKEWKNRRKYVVVPTFKGIHYGIAYFSLDYLEFVKAYGNENDEFHYSEFVHQIKDYNKMCEYMKYNSRLYFENNLFDKGNPIFTNFEQALNIGMEIGLFGAKHNESESSNDYFAKHGIKIAADVLPPRHLNDVKNFVDEKIENISSGLTKEFKKLNS